VGASVLRLARTIARAQLVSIDLEPGGVLGRHPAAFDQLFIVVGGRGWVSGSDGVEEQIEAGMAAWWAAGELHETRAGGGASGRLSSKASSPTWALERNQSRADKRQRPPARRRRPGRPGQRRRR
jgi:hypothetical protein